MSGIYKLTDILSSFIILMILSPVFILRVPLKTPYFSPIFFRTFF
jgi:hypothetical protein